MKITALLENTTVRDDMLTEHGLSLYIQTKEHNILFDMGQTDLFCRNAQTLGIDLSVVDVAILSHGHYDHGGGLQTFLKLNDKAPVYLSRYAFEPHYNGTEKYIGLDGALQASGRLVYVGEEMMLDKGLSLYSCNEKKRNHDLGSFGLNRLEGGSFMPDEFRHEQYLLIEENGKRVLVSGCSHKGIMDIVEWFRPDVLIGGFHFSKLPLDKKLAEYAELLDQSGTEYYTCHCTGEKQFAYMKRYMGKLHYLSCGQSVVI